MDNYCIFCSIIQGKAPASIVYQDDDTMAIMDINPLNPGQIVVFPRKHSINLLETDETTGMHVFRTAMRACKALKACGMEYDGINLFQSNGEAAGQDVFHVHIMVVPRIHGDSMKITAEWKKPDRKELDILAAKIRAVF